MEQNFAQFIEKERARLTEAKDVIIAKKRSYDAEIATIDRELAAISAYERAKTGRAPSTGTRRSGIRQDVLNAIKSHPEGISCADLIEAMGVKGEKSGEKSVSNALSALKKNMSIDLVDGKYKVTTGAKSNRNASQQYRRKPSGGRRGGGGRKRG